jgi:hypothetical protein
MKNCWMKLTKPATAKPSGGKRLISQLLEFQTAARVPCVLVAAGFVSKYAG